MSNSGNIFRPLLLCLLFAAAARLTGATDHIVGANRGWNPNINYTDWSRNQTFYVNDLISFRYQKNTYNVFMVNESGYDNCTTEGALGNWSSGKDFITLDKAQTYYFICGNGFCFSGMKVSVVVHPLPPPPSSSIEGKPKKKENSGTVAGVPTALSHWRALFVCFVIFIAWI